VLFQNTRPLDTHESAKELLLDSRLSISGRISSQPSVYDSKKDFDCSDDIFLPARDSKNLVGSKNVNTTAEDQFITKV